MASHIDHVAIYVQDLDKSVRVFEQAFGLSVANRVDVPERVRAAFLPWGATSIELFTPVDEAARERLGAVGGPIHHLGVLVEDLEGTLQELDGLGISAVGEPAVLGGRRAVFLDTEAMMNARIQLLQPLDAA